MNKPDTGLSDQRRPRDAVRVRKQEMIDLAPRWSAVVPILLSAIEHGTEDGRSKARRGLRNLAREADSSRRLQLRTREVLARLVANWRKGSDSLTQDEKDALAEASTVLALTARTLLAVRHKQF